MCCLWTFKRRKSILYEIVDVNQLNGGSDDSLAEVVDNPWAISNGDLRENGTVCGDVQENGTVCGDVQENTVCGDIQENGTGILHSMSIILYYYTSNSSVGTDEIVCFWFL